MLKSILLLVALCLSSISFSQNNAEILAGMNKKEIRSLIANQNDVPTAAFLMQKSNRQQTSGIPIAFVGALTTLAGLITANQVEDSNDPLEGLFPAFLQFAGITITIAGLVVTSSSRQNFDDSKDLYLGLASEEKEKLEAKVINSNSYMRTRAHSLINQEVSVEAKNLALKYKNQKSLSAVLFMASSIGMISAISADNSSTAATFISGTGIVSSAVLAGESKKKLLEAEEIYQMATGGNTSSLVHIRDEKAIYASFLK